MEIRHLRYFLAVAQTKHFGQAAARLHMAQSPLSQAIRQLESQLGVELFDRTTRRVELAPAGEALLRDAQRILDTVDEAQERVRHVGAGGAGLLRVGVTGLAAYRYLPRLARITARELPGLVLRFKPDLLSRAQELALAQGRIDLAILRPPLRRSDLAVRLIASERFVLAVPNNHRLVGQEPVALAELSDESFILYGSEDSMMEAAVVRVCAAAGFIPKRAQEVTETSTMLTLVAAGLGVALLPESVHALRVDGVRYVAVADDVEIDLALAWRESDTGAALLRVLEALEANGFIPEQHHRDIPVTSRETS
jgi:DNA-binding transcriptional LysR family regulator